MRPDQGIGDPPARAEPNPWKKNGIRVGKQPPPGAAMGAGWGGRPPLPRPHLGGWVEVPTPPPTRIFRWGAEAQNFHLALSAPKGFFHAGCSAGWGGGRPDPPPRSALATIDPGLLSTREAFRVFYIISVSHIVILFNFSTVELLNLRSPPSISF